MVYLATFQKLPKCTVIGHWLNKENGVCDNFVFVGPFLLKHFLIYLPTYLPIPFLLLILIEVIGV
jgi:hypothetical protein